MGDVGSPTHELSGNDPLGAGPGGFLFKPRKFQHLYKSADSSSQLLRVVRGVIATAIAGNSPQESVPIVVETCAGVDRDATTISRVVWIRGDSLPNEAGIRFHAVNQVMICPGSFQPVMAGWVR